MKALKIVPANTDLKKNIKTMLQLCLAITVTSVIASQNPRQSQSHPPLPLQQRPETPTDSEFPSFSDFGEFPSSPTESLGSVTPYLRVFQRPLMPSTRIPSQQNTQRTTTAAAATANYQQSRQFPMPNQPYTSWHDDASKSCSIVSMSQQ